MNKSEQFFYDNAGYSVKQGETQEQGRERTARELAAAETYAVEQGWFFYWEQDQDGCIGCDCDSEDCACSTGGPHETLVCVLLDSEKQAQHRHFLPEHVLASLGSICDATREYGRVVEAELALEAMNRELSIAR